MNININFKRKLKKARSRIPKQDFKTFKAEKIKSLKRKAKKTKKSKKSLPTSNKNLDIVMSSDLNKFKKKHKKSYSMCNTDQTKKDFAEFTSQKKGK